MLDIHPPHHAAATWRDFLIHITTIVLGLLIAIGLEQSVEALHHRHQRHALEEQLRADAERNEKFSTEDAELFYKREVTAANALLALNGRLVKNGRIDTGDLADIFDDPSFQTGITSPSQTAWTVANSNGSVALLPEQEAQVYARLADEGSRMIQWSADYNHSEQALRAAENRTFGRPAEEVRYISAEQRDKMDDLLSDLRIQCVVMVVLSNHEAGAAHAVLHGATSLDRLLQDLHDETERFRSTHPFK